MTHQKGRLFPSGGMSVTEPVRGKEAEIFPRADTDPLEDNLQNDFLPPIKGKVIKAKNTEQIPAPEPVNTFKIPDNDDGETILPPIKIFSKTD